MFNELKEFQFHWDPNFSSFQLKLYRKSVIIQQFSGIPFLHSFLQSWVIEWRIWNKVWLNSLSEDNYRTGRISQRYWLEDVCKPITCHQCIRINVAHFLMCYLPNNFCHRWYLAGYCHCSNRWCVALFGCHWNQSTKCECVKWKRWKRQNENNSQNGIMDPCFYFISVLYHFNSYVICFGAICYVNCDFCAQPFKCIWCNCDNFFFLFTIDNCKQRPDNLPLLLHVPFKCLLSLTFFSTVWF